MRFLTAAAATGLLACITSVGHASDIREKEYGYRYGDAVKSMQGDAFVVCGDCGVDKLSKLPKRQVVTVAMQQPVQPPVVQQPPAQQDRQAAAVWPPVEAYSDAPVTGGGPEKWSDACGPSCLLETVLFKFDSDRINPAEAKKLDSLLAAVPAGAGLTVTGYTCAVGPEEHNKDLSRRRAEKVARYLSGKGAKILSVTGEGECCPVSEDKKLNRRVEITQKEKN